MCRVGSFWYRARLCLLHFQVETNVVGVQMKVLLLYLEESHFDKCRDFVQVCNFKALAWTERPRVQWSFLLVNRCITHHICLKRSCWNLLMTSGAPPRLEMDSLSSVYGRRTTRCGNIWLYQHVRHVDVLTRNKSNRVGNYSSSLSTRRPYKLRVFFNVVLKCPV